MKKILSVFLAITLMIMVLPLGSAIAADEENLLSDATKANGQVTWDTVGGNTWGASHEDQHTGPFGADGGYSWEFHPDKGGHDYTADPVDIYITCDNLAAKTCYEFSYIYSKKFAIDIVSIVDADSADLAYALLPAVSVSESDTTAKKVTAHFQTNDSGNYLINLRINMNVYTSLSSFTTILSDLSLVKLPDDTVLNLLSAANKANGQVTWDTVGGNTWGAGYEDQHKGPFGDEGGYSWEFHPDKGGHDYTADPVDIYIACNNLAANTYYEFSYIYSKKFAIDIVSIVDADSAALAYALLPAVAVSESDTTAKKVTARFQTNDSGNYLINLRINMSVFSSLSSFTTILSDLSLVKLPDDTVLNLLSAATKANGQVTWDTVGGNTWGASYEDQHKGPFGANGGYSWEFHPDNGSHDYDADPVDIYITCNNLEANTYYELSYIYSGKFVIDTISITDSDGNAAGITQKTTVDLSDQSELPAYKAVYCFDTCKAGDYKINLRINMDKYSSVKNFTTILSDLSLLKANAIEFLGNSIRSFVSAEHPQGLRYKFALPTEIIENGLGEYTRVAEIGCIATKSSRLANDELVIDGVYDGVAPVKNCISNMDTQLITEESYPGIKTFCAALINIGYNKTTQITTFSKYSTDYSVRAYVIFENAEGKSKIVYSDTACANVFAVMKKINSSDNTTDIAAVEKVFADFPECKTAYEEWLN